MGQVKQVFSYLSISPDSLSPTYIILWYLLPTRRSLYRVTVKVFEDLVIYPWKKNVLVFSSFLHSPIYVFSLLHLLYHHFCWGHVSIYLLWFEFYFFPWKMIWQLNIWILLLVEVLVMMSLLNIYNLQVMFIADVGRSWESWLSVGAGSSQIGGLYPL